MKNLVKWGKKIDKDEIKSALSYLNLFLEDIELKKIEKLLKKKQKIELQKAANVIRAAHTAALEGKQKEVSIQLQEIIMRKPVKPIILVSHGEKLFIADGYHRICACLSVDDEIEIAAVHIKI